MGGMDYDWDPSIPSWMIHIVESATKMLTEACIGKSRLQACLVSCIAISFRQRLMVQKASFIHAVPQLLDDFR